MAYKISMWDQLSNALAPSMRKLQDIQYELVGTKTNIIRITSTPDDNNNDGFDDLLGDTTDTYTSQIIDNVFINYPFSEVEYLASKDTEDQSMDAISIMDLLPIEMVIPFEGEQDTKPVDLDINDYIVDIIFDHKGNKIPLILTGPRLISTFYGKYVVRKKYELSLFRGNIESEIQTHIDNYISTLGIPEIESVNPSDGSVDVSMSGSLLVNFNLPMYASSVELSTRISPEVDLEFSWDSSSGQLTITPETNLSSGTLYTVTIGSDASSLGRVPMDDDYVWSFTTE